MPKDNITLTAEQYEALLGRIEKVEGKAVPVKNREERHLATVMLFNEKPVVAFENIKTEEKEDDSGEIFLVSSNKINIHVKDGEKVEVKSVNYKNLMENAVRVKVEIVKLDKKEVVVPQGNQMEQIWTSPTDPMTLRATNKSFHSEQVNLEQTILKAVATVRFLEGELNGQTITLDANSLNR